MKSYSTISIKCFLFFVFCQFSDGRMLQFPATSQYDFSNVRTGDVAIFSDKGIIGKTINIAQQKLDSRGDNELKASHVGVFMLASANEILRSLQGRKLDGAALDSIKKVTMSNEGKIANLDEERLWLIEAVGSVEEILKGKLPRVQINTAESVIRKYNGDVYCRHLYTGTSSGLAARLLGGLYLGIPYPTNPQTLIAGTSIGREISKLRSIGLSLTKEKQETLFCSQFVAHFYIMAGIIHPNLLNTGFEKDPSLILPKHYNYGGKFDVLNKVAGKPEIIKLKKM